MKLVDLVSKYLLVTQNVELPLKSEITYELGNSLFRSFEEIVARNDCFEMSSVPSSSASTSTSIDMNDGTSRECYIPLFGEKTKISFFFQQPSSSLSTFGQCVLKIEAENEKDYQWICTRFLDEMKNIDFGDGCISIFPLQKLVAKNYNSQPPHPGYDSNIMANSEILSNIFSGTGGDQCQWMKLKRDGYITIDTNVKTSPDACRKLSDVLKYKTGQDKRVRLDTVAFLRKEEADRCGLRKQFDTLMAIASKMNDEFDFEESSFQPIAPGTLKRPLTNPNEIQAAEYKYGEFYVEHSDNSLDETNRRRNYRCYTAILYCNDDWDMKKDGGALRIYKKSEKIKVPSKAKEICEYVDISPSNGRLLIFDSRLIHAVRETTSQFKRRLALTLWTLRPEESGARGEIYDEGLEDI